MQSCEATSACHAYRSKSALFGLAGKRRGTAVGQFGLELLHHLQAVGVDLELLGVGNRVGQFLFLVGKAGRLKLL